jgi:hypothetical protein
MFAIILNGLESKIIIKALKKKDALPIDILEL